MSFSAYMDFLIDFTWKSQLLAFPNPSVGAMILDKNNAIIALKAHEKFGEAHAEILACKEAFIVLSGDLELKNINDPFEIVDFIKKNHRGMFKETTLFVSLSPCAHEGKTPSCAKFLCEIKPKIVVISANDESKLARGGAEMLRNSGIKVVENILESRGKDLILPFLSYQKKGFFNLYKLAQNLNGTIDSGLISSLDSRIFSHKLRNIANRLVISQRTILNDNPILDSRLINGCAPNVAIIGKSNKIDGLNLRVFESKNRKVEFVSDVKTLKFSGLNIFEGGAEFYALTREIIDCALFFISPNMKNGKNLNTESSGKILNATRIGDDIALWIR